MQSCNGHASSADREPADLATTGAAAGRHQDARVLRHHEPSISGTESIRFWIGDHEPAFNAFLEPPVHVPRQIGDAGEQIFMPAALDRRQKAWGTMPSAKPKSGRLKASNESFRAGETTTGDMRRAT